MCSSSSINPCNLSSNGLVGGGEGVTSGVLGALVRAEVVFDRREDVLGRGADFLRRGAGRGLVMVWGCWGGGVGLRGRRLCECVGRSGSLAAEGLELRVRMWFGESFFTELRV